LLLSLTLLASTQCTAFRVAHSRVLSPSVWRRAAVCVAAEGQVEEASPQPEALAVATASDDAPPEMVEATPAEQVLATSEQAVAPIEPAPAEVVAATDESAGVSPVVIGAAGLLLAGGLLFSTGLIDLGGKSEVPAAPSAVVKPVAPPPPPPAPVARPAPKAAVEEPVVVPELTRAEKLAQAKAALQAANADYEKGVADYRAKTQGQVLREKP